MLAVLDKALLAALRARLPGYATVSPDTLQRRFLETPGQITATGDTVTVRLERRASSPVLRHASSPVLRHASSPVLRHASLPGQTPIPWWGGRILCYEFA